MSAQLVKELRERSGAGMMDCKKALDENGGDIEAAIDWASRKQKTELLSILMNEQHKRFPKKKKTFEL